MKIVEYAKAHPWATGIIVVVGGIIFLAIFKGGGSSEASSSGVNEYRPSDAQIASNAAISVAQINAQAAVAQAGQATQVAQIGAGVQLNSDNQAAQVAMRQIEAAREIGLVNAATQREIGTAEANAEVNRYAQITAALPKLKKKNRDEVLKSLVTGDYGYAGKPTSTIDRIGSNAGSIASAITSMFSLFSDQRLKEGIVYKGKDKQGRNIFEYNYKGSSKRRLGYLAQDLHRTHPKQVSVDPDTRYLTIRN